ncbi:MAG TPA: class I SAM-dependent methyltransferase [Candidatus Nitrosotenuis sp.]|jgi:2-polyprenyl-3-methyl-5-hydroxy-6-metoxy-1,4-benzoquinol methylase|nr:class I SAM-dependent methyltransferase [Candidatus Nitrosotenuis sp.]
MIDPEKVKGFWRARARSGKDLPFESIGNLEQDPDNLKLKVQLETAKVFSWLPALEGRSILDLGAGVGQWSFRFAERGARVVAVEYCEEMARIGRLEAARRGMANRVVFLTSAAEDFESQEAFDIIFMSGLMVYMNDDQAERLSTRLRPQCRPDGLLMLRDGTGLGRRHEIDNQFSEHLQACYSATYRTREQYLALFAAAGFRLVRDEDMFEEGCPLNKYRETRLRLYLFKPEG